MPLSFFLCEYTLFVSCILNECKFLSFRIPQLPSFWRLAMSRYIIEVLSDRLDSFICMVKIKTKFTVTGSKNNIDNYYIKKRLALIKMWLFDLLLFVNYQSPALFVIKLTADMRYGISSFMNLFGEKKP